MGINMPARTVLFTSARKFDGKNHRFVRARTHTHIYFHIISQWSYLVKRKFSQEIYWMLFPLVLRYMQHPNKYIMFWKRNFHGCGCGRMSPERKCCLCKLGLHLWEVFLYEANLPTLHWVSSGIVKLPINCAISLKQQLYRSVQLSHSVLLWGLYKVFKSCSLDRHINSHVLFIRAGGCVCVWSCRHLESTLHLHFIHMDFQLTHTQRLEENVREREGNCHPRGSWGTSGASDGAKAPRRHSHIQIHTILIPETHCVSNQELIPGHHIVSTQI